MDPSDVFDQVNVHQATVKPVDNRTGVSGYFSKAWEGAGKAASKVSEIAAANPVSTAIGKGVGAGLGLAALVPGVGPALGIGAGLMTFVPTASTNQAVVSREKKLFDPELHAQGAGAFDGAGSNMAGVFRMKMLQLYADAPLHLKPAVKKKIEEMGITL